MILVIVLIIVLIVALWLIDHAFNRVDNNKITVFKEHNVTHIHMGTFIFADKETTKEWVEKLKNDKDLNDLMSDNL